MLDFEFNDHSMCEVEQAFRSAGQGQVFDFSSFLTEDDKATLYKNLASFDPVEVSTCFKTAMEAHLGAADKLDDQMQPVPIEVFGSFAQTDTSQLQKYEDDGLKSISEGHVAVILLAGGQGTRLGVPYPKGMYDVGLPSEKTLYQLQAERILKLQQLAMERYNKCGTIPWYIMTSKATREETSIFFKKHNYFNLNPNDVTLFNQGTLPCFTFDGKIILESPGGIASAPDGNGGLYNALRVAGIIEDMERRGVKFIHAYCVDNILVKVADPIFTGFCMAKKAECGAKVVEKTVATEPVGVVCLVNDVYQVVEYSEITDKTAERRNTDRRLTFSAGNIANHFFTLDFLKTVVREKERLLKHHIAKKKIPYVNRDGVTVKPTEPNGIKMEKFVFDVFQFAVNFAVWEVLRQDEFSPLKNADGAAKDTPTTSREDLYSLHARYVQEAGGQFVTEDGSTISFNKRPGEKGETIKCEISPLVSFAGEGLTEMVSKKKFVSPLVLFSKGETSSSSGKPLHSVVTLRGGS